MKKTLIIDGNYMIKRIVPMAGTTFMTDPTTDRRILLENLARHVAAEVRRCTDFIDNIVIVKDHKSWRKAVEIVRPQGQEIDILSYKAHRVTDSFADWGQIFNVFDEFCEVLHKRFNVAYTNIIGAEGDDGTWAWTRYLKQNGIDTLIYCTDSDMNQLANDQTIVFRHIKSKECPHGEIVVNQDWWKRYTNQVENIDIFATDLNKFEANKALFQGRTIPNGIKAVNPIEGVFYKCLSGDKKDNVPGLWNWSNGSKNMSITTKHIWKAAEVVAPGMSFYNSFDESMLYDEKFIRDIITALKPATKQTHIDVDHSYKVFVSNRKMLYLNKREIPTKLQDNLLKNIEEQKSLRATINKLSDPGQIINELGIVKVGSIFDGFLGGGIQ